VQRFGGFVAKYFALHHCERKLSWIRYEILRQWKHALQRRGQRRRLSWDDNT
jgi:RNA-directed DNA polymerase